MLTSTLKFLASEMCLKFSYSKLVHLKKGTWILMEKLPSL